jgi:hypothetical protein
LRSWIKVTRCSTNVLGILCWIGNVVTLEHILKSHFNSTERKNYKEMLRQVSEWHEAEIDAAIIQSIMLFTKDAVTTQ